MEPSDLMEWTWRGFVTVISLSGAILCFFAKRTLQRLDDDMTSVKVLSHSNELNLEKFKTHVSDNYAKETTIQRVHERIDTVNTTIETGFTELRDDIKTLISKVK